MNIPSASVLTMVRNYSYIAAATIQAQCLFRSELPIVQQLFEGMQRLFEEIWYAKFS